MAVLELLELLEPRLLPNPPVPTRPYDRELAWIKARALTRRWLTLLTNNR